MEKSYKIIAVIAFIYVFGYIAKLGITSRALDTNQSQEYSERTPYPNVSKYLPHGAIIKKELGNFWYHVEIGGHLYLCQIPRGGNGYSSLTLVPRKKEKPILLKEE